MPLFVDGGWILPDSEQDRQQRMLDSIRTYVDEIQNRIRDCSTESVVRRCLSKKGYPHPSLHSPAKQIAFLLGLLLATEEPQTSRDFSEKDWDNLRRPLAGLFQVYTERYLPDQEQFANDTIPELKKRQIAMLAFTDYFLKATLATDEQIREHISTYVVPFDEVLSKDLGLSASEALKIVEGIMDKYQADFEMLPVGDPLSHDEAVSSAFRVTRSELIAQHGSQGEVFWKLFTVGRGEGNDLLYPTDQSIVEVKPFIRLSENVAFGCNLKEMLLPILALSEDCLTSGPSEDAYLRHRSKTLEIQAASLFRRILGESAEIYENVFETPDSQNEHDIVIVNDDICLFVEAKSTPPHEPFRDPDRAFTRLRRSFRSDRGIQGAYDQANRLFEAVRKRETVVLYDRQGNEVLRLPGSVRDRAFCICVTRDNHGPTATCLSFLLKKKETNPYPWVVSALDLENIAEAWQYFRWDARQLRAFLSQREKLHSSLSADDELDYVGAFILHCGLYWFESDAILPGPIDPSYANIFDAIHEHLVRGGPPVRVAPVYPVENSGEKFLRTGESIYSVRHRLKRIRLRRNELCQCGSHVKAKRCHGVL